MYHKRIVASLCLITASLAISGVACGRGTDKHGKMVPADVQMKKLHAMMPMFSAASAGLETALEKSEVTAVVTEAGKILAAIPDLKKSKPHKNVKQRKKYVELATNLEASITLTVNLAKKGEFAEAKVAFKKVEQICAACHAKFRD